MSFDYKVFDEKLKRKRVLAIENIMCKKKGECGKY